MKTKLGFTLIELLVVVLIIGILTAIAVPQYQLAVAKSEFSTLKFKTRALAEAVNRYQLATGTLPSEFSELDISLPDIKQSHSSGAAINIYFNNGEGCLIWIDGWDRVRCSTKNGKVAFYYNTTSLKPSDCLAYKDNNDIGHKMCKQENIKNIDDRDSYTWYEY